MARNDVFQEEFRHAGIKNDSFGTAEIFVNDVHEEH